MKRAVLGLKARKPDTKFVCLSNSNPIYINTILEVCLAESHQPLTLLYRASYLSADTSA
jgi:pyridoxal phosphate phosphatase PHOSPHO2